MAGVIWLMFYRFTGPAVDHTTGTDNGFYMYIEASGGSNKVGDRAWLMTEHVAASNDDHCFSFWYHMAGKGNLVVLEEKEGCF